MMRSIPGLILKGIIMNNFDRYLNDINPEILQDIAQKRKRKTVIYDILGGFILFFMLGLGSYLVLIYGQ